jgi:hypothetical protein
MFECKYKCELEDCLKCAKYVYKSQRRKQDKAVAVLLPILMVCMVAMLIFDIVTRKSIIWDILLLGALAVLQIMYILIPVMVVSAQKKAYNKQNFKDMDYLLITITQKDCVEEVYKNNEVISKNSHSLRYLTSYLEDEDSIILIFNKVEFVCVKKQHLKPSDFQLKEHLKNVMKKNAK